MDLNELLSRHQIALIRADEDGAALAAPAHAVGHYAELLAKLRARLGVANYAGARS